MENDKPIKMEFTIASVTQGIEYWLNKVVLRETIVVDNVMWNPNENKFIVRLENGIQVGKKL